MILGLVSTPSRYVHTLAVKNSFCFTGTRTERPFHSVVFVVACISFTSDGGTANDSKTKKSHSTERRESFHARVLSLHCTTESWGVTDPLPGKSGPARLQEEGLAMQRSCVPLLPLAFSSCVVHTNICYDVHLTHFNSEI